jgi:hypothetical protein
MKLTIEIDMDNDAFFLRPKEEAQRIIKEGFKAMPPASELRHMEWQKKLLDINGNTVGTISTTDK